MTTVAITGVTGLVGTRLAAVLEEDPEVERILGLDVHAPHRLTARKMAFRQVDVRDTGLEGVLDGVDVVVHLAFQLDPTRDEATMRSVNVEGTRNVFTAAAAAGVGKVVYASSAVVYGAHPDNDLPLGEDSPLRANPDFSYAEHKLEVERWLQTWRAEHPELTVTVLRPAIVAGPGVDNFITRLMEAPRPTLVKGHRPPLQFVHVDDLAAALAHAILTDLPGAYNVAAEGWLSMDEVLAIQGRKPLEVPEEVAFSLTDRMWRAGIGVSPPGVVHYFMHPWVLSVRSLMSTGWAPTHTNRDALAALVEGHRDHLAVGRVRTSRSTVRRAVALAGTLTAAWAVRRALERRDA